MDFVPQLYFKGTSWFASFSHQLLQYDILGCSHTGNLPWIFATLGFKESKSEVAGFPQLHLWVTKLLPGSRTCAPHSNVLQSLNHIANLNFAAATSWANGIHSLLNSSCSFPCHRACSLYYTLQAAAASVSSKLVWTAVKLKATNSVLRAIHSHWCQSCCASHKLLPIVTASWGHLKLGILMLQTATMADQ